MASDKEMIDEFLEKKQNDEQQMILDFANAYLECELRKKEVSEDIKIIKAEAKENGILVKRVMSAVAALKKEIKHGDLVKQEEQEMLELLSANPDIVYKIDSLLNNN